MDERSNSSDISFLNLDFLVLFIQSVLLAKDHKEFGLFLDKSKHYLNAHLGSDVGRVHNVPNDKGEFLRKPLLPSVFKLLGSFVMP